MGFALNWVERPQGQNGRGRPSFDINRFGMAELLEEMARQRMLDLTDAPDNDREASQLTASDPQSSWPANGVNLDDPLQRDDAAFRRARDAGPGGIPYYKLDSNRHWLVTPVEIQGALANASPQPSPAFGGGKARDATSERKLVLAAVLPDSAGDPAGLEHGHSGDVRRMSADDGRELNVALWQEWLDFLRGATEHRGITVR